MWLLVKGGPTTCPREKTLPMAKKKKAETYVSICGTCAQPIDLNAVWAALKVGDGYIHECGKALVEGKK